MPVDEYKIPPDIAVLLQESKVISIETLDSILNLALGLHFLEPSVSFEETTKVKPMMG
jgi:hypothetical protein